MARFEKAVRRIVKARVGLVGPSGSGKTMTALKTGKRLAEKFGGRMAVVDTEHESASIYADRFDFDVLELSSFSAENYIDAIESAGKAGYTVLVIDSLSHAWSGKDGILAFVDEKTMASRSKNAFNEGWRHATPKHNNLIDAMLSFPGHLIVTMRSKVEYVVEKNERGQSVPRKVGMQPIQREGMEYEFSIVGDLDAEHTLTITKSRASILADKVFTMPDDNFAKPLIEWLEQGEEVATAPKGRSRSKLLSLVERGEAACHKNVHEKDNSRAKHMDGLVNLSDCTDAQLESYLDHLVEKKKKLDEEAAAKVEADKEQQAKEAAE